MNYLILITIAIISFFIGRKSVKRQKTFTPKSEVELSDMRVEAKKSLDERMENRKEKILNLMNSEAIHQEELKTCNLDNTKKGITCNDVEELLDVSGATARKYLNELEDEEKITQIGESGKGVYYTLNI